MLSKLPDEQVCMRLARPELESLIHAATLAPSPDNNQPWLFEERPNGEVLLWHDRLRALSSDVNDMFSMIALGAALENLCLAAGERGLRVLVRYPQDFGPDTEGREIVASILFTEGGTMDPLAAFIEPRATSRKPYNRQPVAPDDLRQLELSIANNTELHLHWLSDRTSIRKLSWIVASADRLRFEYQPFHAELYRQLRFTPQESETTCDGLDVRCLELPPGAVATLRWLRYWPRMQRLNRFGLSRVMSLASVLQVWRTGTIGLLTTTDASRRGYLQAGRALQRVWLTATMLHLSLHPLGSLPIFLTRLKLQADRELSNLQGLATRFYRLFPEAAQRNIVLLFRLGFAPQPTTRSLRRHPNQVGMEKA